MKFFIKTFGCQMNEHDSARMAGILEGLGHVPADDYLNADLILFNTCTVRERAHHKAISEIGRAISRKARSPDLIVGVCGCVAQEEKGNLFEIYPELDLVFGPDQTHRLAELLKQCIGKSQQGKAQLRQIATELVNSADEYNWVNLQVASGGSRVTSTVTIMKGCNNRCSFCIVPSVRGNEVSRPADEIINEISALAKRGTKEILLLGQNVNSYAGLPSFAQLLKRISTETDILRIRYTSPHPKDLGDDLIEEHATNKKLCRHMHLPLQAGSDSVLREMKRSYSKRRFLEKTAKLRERVPGIDITTDIIVGFPGETEKDFSDTLDVVKEASFDGMFAFKYSPRPGTKAAELKDDVPQEIKEERLQRLLELNAEIWRKKTAELVGTEQEVLVEGLSKRASAIAQLTGRNFGNKIINFAGNLNLVGLIVNVKVEQAGANSLKGEAIS